jgi:ubiquitin carboxyl-terminal hydrolase 36/42
MTNHLVSLQGIKNFGNTCYANSVLQCLSHAQQYFSLMRPPIAPLRMKETDTLDLWLCLSFFLHHHHQNTLEDIHVRCLLNCVYTAGFERGKQHDAHEFLLLLLRCLDQNPDPRTPTNIMDLFHIRLAQHIECEPAFHRMPTREESAFTLELTLGADLAHLNNYIASSLSQQLSDYRCAYCGDQVNAYKDTQLLDLPSILIIHLARVRQIGPRFRAVGYNMTKINEFVQIPLKLQLELESNTRIVNYELFAVCFHSGQVGHGHYTSMHKKIKFIKH